MLVENTWLKHGHCAALSRCRLRHIFFHLTLIFMDSYWLHQFQIHRHHFIIDGSHCNLKVKFIKSEQVKFYVAKD